MAGRRPLIDGSSGAPFQPDPHRPLTRHGAAPPNMIQSALLLPSCQLCKLVAGLPSLAAWGYFGGDLLAAAAGTSRAAGVNVLSTSNRSTTANAFEHADKCARAYMPESCATRVRPSGVRRPTSSFRCHSTTRCEGHGALLSTHCCSALPSMSIAACVHLSLLLCGRLWLWI